MEFPCYARLWLLVSRWFQVLFHSPIRGTFHLSLTVLVHYRSRKIFSLGRRSSRLPTSLHVASSTCPRPRMVKGNDDRLIYPFVYGAITLFGCPFQAPSTRINHLSSSGISPFARHYLGNHKIRERITENRWQKNSVFRLPFSVFRFSHFRWVLFSFPSVTKMFQFTEFPSRAGFPALDEIENGLLLWSLNLMDQKAPLTPGILHRISCSSHEGFPHSEISGSKDVWLLPEAYRPPTASFIGLPCQGIHLLL